jgi:hypothetical protein
MRGRANTNDEYECLHETCRVVLVLQLRQKLERLVKAPIRQSVRGNTPEFSYGLLPQAIDLLSVARGIPLQKLYDLDGWDSFEPRRRPIAAV